MTKYVIGAFIAAALMPLATFAYVDLDDQLFKINGKFSDTVKAGSSFDVTVNVDSNDGEDVEFVRIRLNDDGGNALLNHCEPVGTIRDAFDREVKFDVKTPSDFPESAPTVEAAIYGIDGEARSNGCDTDNEKDTHEWDNRLFITDSSNSSSVGGPVTIASLTTDVNRLANIVGCMVVGKVYDETTKQCVSATTTTPAPAGKCAELTAKMQGTVSGQGQYWFDSPNGALQAFLLYNHFDIPWLTNGSGTKYGFYGDQTAAAIGKFKSANSCY